MTWPTLELKVDNESTILYEAGVPVLTLPTTPDVKDQALDAAFKIVEKYHRDLPLVIYDHGEVWHLKLTTTGDALPAEQPEENQPRKWVKPLIGSLTAIALLAGITALAWNTLTPSKNTQQPNPTQVTTQTQTPTESEDQTTSEAETTTKPSHKTTKPTSKPTQPPPKPKPAPNPQPEPNVAPEPEPQPVPAPQPAPKPRPAPAPRPAPKPAPASITSMSTSVSSNSGTATFSVTTIGGTPPVTATIAGKSITFTGSGTITGIPSGTHSWTTSSQGLINSGTIYVP